MYPIMKRISLCALFISFPFSLINAQSVNGFRTENLESYIEFRANHGKNSGITTIYKGDEIVFESIKGEAK